MRHGSKKLRATSSIVRAVIRSMYWGGTGRFWNQHFAKTAKGKRVDSAFVKNDMSEETSDEREYRNARFALKLHGSFVAAVKSDILIGRCE